MPPTAAVGRLQLPRIRLKAAAWLLALMTSVSLLQGWSLQESLGPQAPRLMLLFVSGAVGAWATLPIIQCAVLNAGAPRLQPARFFLVHTLVYVARAILSKALQLTLGQVLAGVL